MKKVLVVDDEPDVLKLIKARVESLGHTVVAATDGHEALKAVEQGTFDLIITDVVMPKIDGFQLYKTLKSNPATKDIPVLVLTARGKMEDTFRIIGVDDFISKPYETEDFMAKVKKLLDSKVSKAGAPTSQPSTPASVAAAGNNPSVQKPILKTNLGLKVVVSGANKTVVGKMSQLLKQTGCIIETASTGMEIISRSNAMVPNMIIMDILMDDAAPEDMVSILKRSPELAKSAIIFYSYFETEAGDDLQQTLASIESAKDNCLAAGATAHIGSFNDRTFIASISPFIKK